ncbi:hypothetical protein HKX48_008730 [Thoreauomyces humboldtii]|nr:hypothetical protein HKX48_008730 [Thoreauomyces humboldtii]
MKLTLVKHSETLSIHRLPPTPETIASCSSLLLPSPSTDASIAPSFRSLTVSPTELSLIIPSSLPPPPHDDRKSETDWAAFQVQGVLDFSLVGILSHLVAPLREAAVSVFVVSTYDTDWVMVKTDKADTAARVWREIGCTVVD